MYTYLFLLFLALGMHEAKGIHIAAILGQFFVLQVHNVRHNATQKVLVMRNHQQGSLETRGQIILQPYDSIQILYDIQTTQTI